MKKKLFFGLGGGLLVLFVGVAGGFFVPRHAAAVCTTPGENPDNAPINWHVDLSIVSPISSAAKTAPLTVDGGYEWCAGNLSLPVDFKVTVSGHPSSTWYSANMNPNNGAYTLYNTSTTGNLDVSSLSPGSYTAIATLGDASATAQFTIVTSLDHAPKLLASLAPTSTAGPLVVSGTADGGYWFSKTGTCNVQEPGEVDGIDWSVVGTSLSGSFGTSLTEQGGLGERCTGNTLDYGGDNTYAYSANLDVSSLAPGSYSLILSAQWHDGVVSTSLPFTVLPSSGGTITVNSVNSQTGASVASQWEFPVGASAGNPCGTTDGTCPPGASGSYANQPVGQYNLASVAFSAGPDFTLSGIREIAQTPKKKTFSFADLVKQVFTPQAFAQSVCDGDGITYPASCQGGSVFTLSITAASPIITFDILWDPTNEPTPSSTQPTTTCTPGATQACTSSANSCGMTSSGTETCSSDGSTWSSCSATAPSDSACPTTCTPGATQSCTSSANSCGMTSSGTETCSSDGSTWSSCNATAPSDSTCPTTPPSPACLIEASPSTIVPPEVATLSWYCGTAPCSIDQGIGTVSMSGSKTIAPTSTAAYTLSCDGGAYTQSATIGVNNPGIIEINP